MLQVFELLPLWYQYSVIIIFGLIIGSFLNVIIYRYHTGKSLNGHSHCMSCGHQLRWYELFPLVSYMGLRGRCRECRCRIPSRYFWVELLTAGLFALMLQTFSIGGLFFFSLVLIAVLIVITVYDIYHLIIPNELVGVLSVLALGYYVLLYGFNWNTNIVLSHIAGALGAFIFYGSLWLVSKGRWIGFGDAKLAIPLGFMLGASASFSFVVLSFWVGAVLSVLLMCIPVGWHKVQNCCAKNRVANYTKSFTMKSEVPFAPFIIIAFLLVFLYQIDVLQMTSLVM